MSRRRRRAKQPVFRDGKVHVCSKLCSTCIFRPGNLMHLQPGRVDGMVADCQRADGVIPCHCTLGGAEAVCRGFFEKHATPTLQIAQRLGCVEFVDPPAKPV